MWTITSSMWAVTVAMYDVQALCGLLNPLTLTLTITRNPNTTTVASTCLKRLRVAATVIRLEILDTALYLNEY